MIFMKFSGSAQLGGHWPKMRARSARFLVDDDGRRLGSNRFTTVLPKNLLGGPADDRFATLALSSPWRRDVASLIETTMMSPIEAAFRLGPPDHLMQNPLFAEFVRRRPREASGACLDLRRALEQLRDLQRLSSTAAGLG